MIRYAQALQRVLAASAPFPAETICLADAEGRVLAVPVRSTQSLPPFDNSAMDGFALNANGEEIAAGSSFAVQGWQAAGDSAVEGGKGAWEIMTGARMPEGLDSVVPVEKVEVLETHLGRPLRIRLCEPVRPGQNVRLCGQDVERDEVVLEAGAVLDTNALTLLHAIGTACVQVQQRVPVAVIATGKELVAATTPELQSGQIRDSNRPYLCSRLKAAGAQVVWQGLVGDEEREFSEALDAALAAGAQVVISTGAVSQGRYDFVPEALRARSADIIFHKVAIRPGKPLLFARLPGGALFFGLPGNPISAAAGQRFFVEPALRRMLALPIEQPIFLPLPADMRKPPGVRVHLRAQVVADAGGGLMVRVLPGQESFRLKTMVAANAWVVLDGDNDHVAAGTLVGVHGWGHKDPLQLTLQEMT